MVLQKAKQTQYKDNQIITVSKFAYFSVRLKRNSQDKTGELIWLEKYVVTKKYNIGSSLTWWTILKSERQCNYVLNKLENTIE